MSASFIVISALILLRQKAAQPILNISQLSIAQGESVAIVGPSGAGKTSLLSVLSGLTTPSSGRVSIGRVLLGSLDPSALTHWRRRSVGIAFQAPHLIPELRAFDNVILPSSFDQLVGSSVMHERAHHLLKVFEIDPTAMAGALSRGEQQRVALARALLSEPPLLIADEPTANLDTSMGGLVIRTLVEEARRFQATLIVATHDPRLSAQCDRVIVLENGCVARAS